MKLAIYGIALSTFMALNVTAFVGPMSNGTPKARSSKFDGTSTTRVNMASPSPSTDNPRLLVSQGMQTFREGNIKESIELFDRADRAVPDGSFRPFLWQRGISYYYADQFQEGSEQFRFDVKVNPLDVEEIVWDIACLSRLTPEVVPPLTMMALPQGKKDRRKIMVRFLFFVGCNWARHAITV